MTDRTAFYANFCRVTGTPEELIIDFGLNNQPFGENPDPIVISQRLVTDFFRQSGSCVHTLDPAATWAFRRP